MIFPNPITALKSLYRVIWHRFHGVPVIVPVEIVDKRNAHCTPCESNEHGQCRECTCFIILKTQLSMEKCPKKKWGIFTKRGSKTLINRHD